MTEKQQGLERLGYAKLSLNGRVAIVTGGGSGIGRASALLMAARGAKVVVADINQQGAEETEKQIKAQGGEALAMTVDVSTAENLKKMVSDTVAHYGGLNILFNNAFFNALGSVEELDEDDWDRTQTVSLKSVYLGCKYAIPELRKAGGGAIINCASVHAVVAYRKFAAYDAAKAGVCGLTRQMAMDYASENIRVNAILPGPTYTGAFDLVPDSYVETVKRRMPILRLGLPEETAEAVAFLASDAASLIHGIAMPVDGGSTIIGEQHFLDTTPEIF